jgi:hypothetical protein
MTSTNATGLCTACNKSNARFCNRCKSARYCSTACQHDDWPTHQLLCATFSRFDALSRPTDEHFRAILFPVDNKKPKVIWLRCEWCDNDEDDDTGGRYQSPVVEPFLGLNAFPRHAPIQYNPALKRRLLDTIYVCHRDAFLIDGSPANNSVAGITATKPEQFHDWRGLIIAYGMVGLGVDQTACKDLDMNDFRHITDYFLAYDYNPVFATHQSTDIKVKGVKINCLGDRIMFSKPDFEAVQVSLIDPIFAEHDTSDITNRIGLPIFTRRCSPDPRWVHDEGNKIFEHKSPFNNQDATFLHLCCDPKAEFDLHIGTMGWGWASQQWQDSVGSIIVVRQDKKPLSPLHVEALCNYCRYEIHPLLAHSIGEYYPEEPISKDAVLAMICRPTFVIYWSKLLNEKLKKGEDILWS